jgi:hypothetical protein
MIRDLKIKVEINLTERKDNISRPSIEWDHHDKEREVFFKCLTRNIF